MVDRRSLIGLIVSLVILVSASAYAGQSEPSQSQQARSAAENLSGVFQSRYGSSSGMKNNVINPLMGNSTMTTFNGEKSFHAQLECPAAHKFLEIFFMPYPTGDFKADITVWSDGNSNQSRTLEIDNVSGVCQYGFISCNRGTWNNCKFYKWQWKNNMLTANPEPDDTELGQCVCINSSCHMSFRNMWEQIKSLFSANLAVFVANQLNEAISKVSVPPPSEGGPYVEDFYGQNPESCKVVSKGDYAGSPYRNLKQYYQDSDSLNDAVSAEMASESSDNETPYYNVINSEYMKDNPHEYKTCVIQRIPTVDNSTWIAEDGSEYDVSCQSVENAGGGYYWCGLNNLSGGVVPPGFCTQCYNAYRCLAKTDWYFFGSVYDDYGVAISVNGKLVVAKGMWSDCGAATDAWDPAWVWMHGYYNNNGKQKIHIVICEDEYKNVGELSMYRGSPPPCGGKLLYDQSIPVGFNGEPITVAIRNSGECNSGDLPGTNIYAPAVDASAQLFLKRRESIKIDTQDSCSNMNLSGCKLKDEIVCSHTGANQDNQSQGCFYVWKNYHPVATESSAMCQTVVDPQVTDARYIVCANGSQIWYYPEGNQANSVVIDNGTDLWWYVKRVYKCDNKGITINTTREELVASSIHEGGAEGGYTVYPYEDTKKSGEIKWQGSKSDNCTYSCVFKNAAGHRSFGIASGNEAIGANIGSSITDEYKIVPCVQNPQTGKWACPAPKGNWEKIQDCECTKQGVQTIAVMQALIDAAKDIICSKE